MWWVGGAALAGVTGVTAVGLFAEEQKFALTMYPASSSVKACSEAVASYKGSLTGVSKFGFFSWSANACMDDAPLLCC